MVKEVIINYEADSKGNLKLFEVVRSNYNGECGCVDASYAWDLYTDITLWLHPYMSQRTSYIIKNIKKESILLGHIHKWREALKKEGYKLIVLNEVFCKIGEL